MNWWSWRAFQALAEAAPLIGDHNPSLAIRINSSLEKITSGIKSDLAGQTQTTKEVSGLTVPQWLPQGSASDQAATLLLALVNYCSLNNDVILEQYISSLAEGVSMMQQGDADHFPYGCFLSWENQWHAYGNEQAYALLKAAVFLSNNSYLDKALLEISNFYPWLINNDYRSDMLFKKVNDEVSIVSEKQFDQIAYGITPMALAAAEAYSITSEDKYADIAGRIAAWYLGANKAGLIMYEKETGRGFDGLSSSSINSNSGAESTIEALLCFQLIEKYPAIKAAVNKYRAD